METADMAFLVILFTVSHFLQYGIADKQAPQIGLV